MNTILKTKDLDVGYENKCVISNIKIEALRGQTICLIGPNGAGKSTILRTLSGMLAPVKGTVYLGEKDIVQVKPLDKAKTMAVVLTEKFSMQMTTAYEVVSMGRTPYTNFFGRLSEEDHKIIKDSLEIVGATNLTDRDYVSLSDGEKQKVMIARALAQEPTLIILDEPTSHLDIKHKIEVVRILHRLSQKKGLTVILALHDIDIAIKGCETVLLVKDGQVIDQGKPEEVVKQNTINDLYNIKGASFDYLLGSVEICNKKIPEVAVVAGDGTGAPVFRMISRLGYGMAVGVLHKNDVDYAVAKGIGADIVAEESFSTIEEDRITTMKQSIDQVSCVVDTGFTIGDMNRGNQEILRYALQRGCVVFSFRNQSEILRIYGENQTIISVEDMTELEHVLKSHFIEK